MQQESIERQDQWNDQPLVKMKDALGDLKMAFEPIFEDMAKFVDAVANIISKVAEWINQNPELLSTLWEVGKIIGEVVLSFIALKKSFEFISAIPQIIAAFTSLLNPMNLIILAIAGIVVACIEIVKHWDVVKEKAIEIWNGIKDFLSQTMGVISSTISGVWNGIKDFFSNVVSNIKNVVVNKFNDMKNAISEKMRGVKDAISNIWDNIKNLLSNINLFDIGKNIIQGLINGITSMAGAVWKGVKDTVGGAVDKFKDFLGIHSPSRLFTEFGEYVGEGFVNGIDNMKNAVVKAGQDMADASIPSINQPNLAAMSGNQAINVDVVVNVDNSMDGKRLADTLTTKVTKAISMQQNSRNIARGLSYI